ncbi:MAG TPA: efflux RND transporter periplasmic adaptor subunit [Bacteroidota bacterium]|nr:efflux RND transporter periplasmic adaptor subunit [Bacteroidota bacterium]
MKKIIFTAVICVALGVLGGWLVFRPAGVPIAPADSGALTASGVKKILYYKDPMHPWYTSDKPGKAPDCGMDLVPVYEGETTSSEISIDPTVVQNMGVKTEVVAVRNLHRTIRTVGKIQYDETRIHSINTKVAGWVEKLHVDYTGQSVRKGEPLLSLYSPDLVSTQEEYLQALRYEKQLSASTIREAKAGAEDLAASAKRRLLFWDIPESEIASLQRRGTPEKLMTVYAPVDGYVIEKSVYDGQNVMPGMELYKIADLSDVWAIADVYQYELPWVRVGQKASISLSYLPGKTFDGTVSFIYPMLSADTRTVKVRITVRNTPGLEFKPEMFATVEITSPVEVHAVAVPEQAVIRSGERNIVVIANGKGHFDPRDVALGVSADGYVQVLNGVKAGESIVVSSQFLIDSESNLQAAIGQMSGQAGMNMPAADTSMPQRSGGAEPHHEGMPGM